MKMKSGIAVLTVLLAASVSHAATTVTATGNGEWNSTVPDQPWQGGIVPQPTDNADIESPFNVTVATNASVDYIYGTGTVTLGTNATLTVIGANAGEGTQSLGLLDTTAPGNTVIYQGNAFFCKHQNYQNLSLLGFGNLYNGEIGVAGDGDFAMTINGNLILGGTAGVQQADTFNILGNLIIGAGCKYDSSCSAVTVIGNTIVSGILTDGCGSTSSLDDVYNNITITTNGTWNLGDVVEWSVGGSLTNNGTVVGIGFGSITMVGTGIIAGSSPITPPFIRFATGSTVTVEDTVEVTTNTPDFFGTLQFDLAHPGEIIVPAYLGQDLYYNGTLNITNTGPQFTASKTFQLFSAVAYNPFGFSPVNLPPVPANLSIVDNTLNDGTISVIALTLSAVTSGNNLTVSWDNTTFPGYELQVQTNKTGVGKTNWVDTGVIDGPFMTTIASTNGVYFRLRH